MDTTATGKRTTVSKAFEEAIESEPGDMTVWTMIPGEVAIEASVVKEGMIQSEDEDGKPVHVLDLFATDMQAFIMCGKPEHMLEVLRTTISGIESRLEMDRGPTH